MVPARTLTDKRRYMRFPPITCCTSARPPSARPLLPPTLGSELTPSRLWHRSSPCAGGWQARRSLLNTRGGADEQVHSDGLPARRAMLAMTPSPPLNLTVNSSEAAQPPMFLAPAAEGATRVCEVLGNTALMAWTALCLVYAEVGVFLAVLGEGQGHSSYCLMAVHAVVSRHPCMKATRQGSPR